MIWIDGYCKPKGNNCPKGTYFNGQTCIPYTPCTGGRIWNAKLAQCVCPSNSFWNGESCNMCGNGQIYGGSMGCYCPEGTFYDGVKCITVT